MTELASNEEKYGRSRRRKQRWRMSTIKNYEQRIYYNTGVMQNCF